MVAAFAELEDETKSVLGREAYLRSRVGLRSGLECVIPGPVMEMVSGLGRGERVLRFNLGESVLVRIREESSKFAGLGCAGKKQSENENLKGPRNENV